MSSGFERARGGLGLNIIPHNGTEATSSAVWDFVFIYWSDTTTGWPNVQAQIDAAKSLGATAVRFIFRYPGTTTDLPAYGSSTYTPGSLTKATFLSRVDTFCSYVASKGMWIFPEVGVFNHASRIAFSDDSHDAAALTNAQIIAGSNFAAEIIQVAMKYRNVFAVDIENESLSYAAAHSAGGGAQGVGTSYFSKFKVAYDTLKALFPGVKFGISQTAPVYDSPPLQLKLPYLAGLGTAPCVDFVDCHDYTNTDASNFYTNQRALVTTYGPGTGNYTAGDENYPLVIGENGLDLSTGAGFAHYNQALMGSGAQTASTTARDTAFDNANAWLTFRWACYPQCLDGNTDWGLVDSSFTPRSPLAAQFTTRASKRQLKNFVIKENRSPRRVKH